MNFVQIFCANSPEVNLALATVKLNLEDILNAAQSVIDEEGLAGLNMRAVASRLDARASALYWHVRNRSEMLTLTSNGYYQRAFDAVPAGLGWRDWLRAYGNAFHAELLAHRDAAQVCGLSRPTATSVRAGLDRLVAPLVGQGLTHEQALACQSSVIALCVGWAMFEQSPHMKSHLSRSMDLPGQFRHSLEALVAGLPATLKIPAD